MIQRVSQFGVRFAAGAAESVGPPRPGADDVAGVPAGSTSDPGRDRRLDVVESQRPWGSFEQLATGEPVTVKVLTVEPGHRLSLQRHRYRQELWQVLDGPLEVTVGDRSWSAQPGERVLVPVGAVHRLGNSGDRTGRVLEVAFGHFDEADIERLDDDYTR